MELHIYTSKDGKVVKTVLIDGNKYYETDKFVIQEGEYASIKGRIYELGWNNYIDHEKFNHYIYELIEVLPIRDLNFLLNKDNMVDEYGLTKNPMNTEKYLPF